TQTTQSTTTINGFETLDVYLPSVSGYAVYPTTQPVTVTRSDTTVIFKLLAPPAKRPVLLIGSLNRLTLLTVSNRLPDYTYQIQYTTSLGSSASWFPLDRQPLSIPNLPENVDAVDFAVLTQRFYRAVWVPSP